MNLWRGKSIEEWGIGNGDFRLIDQFSPKIEGIIFPVENFMKRNRSCTSLCCPENPIRRKPFRKQNPILKPSDFPVKKLKAGSPSGEQLVKPVSLKAGFFIPINLHDRVDVLTCPV
jgi:hypothetical protein